MSLKKLLSKFIYLHLFFSSFIISAQTEIDTIQQKSYQEIKKFIRNAEKLEGKIFYSKIYAEKAKKEGNDNLLSNAYHYLSYYHKAEKKLQYADSIIHLTSLKSNSTYPAIAYQIKGDYYFDNKQYKKAMSNYSFVSSFANKHDNKKMIFRSNLNMGNLKRKIAVIDDALDIFKENLSFSRKHQDSLPKKYYLTAISSIASVYNEKQLTDSATYYNKLGIKEASKVKDEFYYNHFVANQGITHFYKKDFRTAIDSLEKYIPFFEKNKNKEALYLEELSFIYYYSGESYFKSNYIDRAIDYFKKVDTIFKETQFTFPSQRSTYVKLINYYKEKKDYQSQLTYINQLIKYDSILHANESYLNKEIIKEYDVPKLKAEKESILKDLQEQKTSSNYIVFFLSSLFILSTVGFLFQYRKRKTNRKRFDEIINTIKPSQKRDIEQNHDDIKEINIPQDVVINVLNALESFEINNEFTSQEITLNSLAKNLNTNPNYLSKIINYYKKISFSNYLNKLRVDYAIDQLKSNPMYRKYTIKAISSEAGFNTAQSFTRAFYSSKGINPSYFIKQLEKIKD
jgi:YesN/AraC family two-component response regulator